MTYHVRHALGRVAALLLATAACGASRGGSPTLAARVAGGWPADSASALASAYAVIAALDSLQWERFRAAFAPDITVFMPLSELPSRLDGRDTVAAAFHAFFEAARANRAARGVTRPPYLGLAPRDWLVQPLAPGAVIVTFQLGPSGQAPSRRTLVLRRRPGSGDWELVHLHGSPPPRPAPAGPPPGKN